MTRQIIRTPDAPASPATYSQAVRAAGLVFVLGTGPYDAATGAVIGSTIQKQTWQCLTKRRCHPCRRGKFDGEGRERDRDLLEQADFACVNEEWRR